MRRPRVRGLEERFESRILPLFKRRTREVGELLPQPLSAWGWRRVTSIWHYEVCWVKGRRCRHRPSRG